MLGAGIGPEAAISDQGVRMSSTRRACYKCGNVGHYAEVCSSSERLCYNCKQPGHESNGCPHPRTTESQSIYCQQAHISILNYHSQAVLSLSGSRTRTGRLPYPPPQWWSHRRSLLFLRTSRPLSTQLPQSQLCTRSTWCCCSTRWLWWRLPRRTR